MIFADFTVISIRRTNTHGFTIYYMKIRTRQLALFATLFAALVACGKKNIGDAVGDTMLLLVNSDTVNAFIGPDCMELVPPAIIEKSGCYRVVKDYSVVADADFGITVFASHVKLDLNGHKISGSGPKSTAAGVHAIGVERITIQNGTLRDFLYGVRIDPSAEQKVIEATVRGVHVAQGTARGIHVAAENVTVEGSRVEHLSGYSGWPASHTIGIEVAASQCAIKNNHVLNYLPEGVGEAVGISLSSPVDNCTVSSNEIKSAEPPKFGRTIGIWVSGEQITRGSEALMISRNIVGGADYAFFSGNTSLIEHNEFSVACGPSDVTTFRTYVEQNVFLPLGRRCSDTVEHLETLAAIDPRWRIRLAAALIERQSVHAATNAACEDYARAKAILVPLAAEAVAGAVEQIARVDRSASSLKCNT